MTTLADRIIAFNTTLNFDGTLPEGIAVMNPFRESQGALEASSAFYKKYYNDNKARHMILGINPGRFGGGLTGVPFTDPKRLQEVCGVSSYHGPITHEPSSVFVYEVIEGFGGPERFYSEWYINSVSPLGFTAKGKGGKEINYNYYDNSELAASVHGFAAQCIQKQIDLGMKTDVCFCLGTGKNARALHQLNAEHHFFEKIVPLEHPRYIIQYKSKQKSQYIEKYLKLLNSVTI